MRINRYIGIVFLLCLGLQSLAQEQFSLSQYYQVQSILNPGFTGIDDFLDIKIGFRRKWAGLNNSPSTSFVSAFGSIGDKTVFNQSPIRTSNPNQIEYIKSQRDKVRYHGIGGYITKQVQGAFNQTNIMVNYAYNMPLSTKLRVSFGTSIGFNSIKIDLNSINVWDKTNDAIYQAYANGDNNYSRFMITLGGVVYGEKSYLGISYLPVIDLPVSGDNEDLSTNDKIVIMAGTKFAMSPSMSILPSVLVEANITGKSRVVGNILLDINSLIKTGFSYSSANDLGVHLIFNYKNEYGFGYVYETNLGNDTTIGNGTHEIVLSVYLFNHLNSGPRLW